MTAETSLRDLALLTREFNRAMGLPEGASTKIVAAERGQEYGRMLHEEIREIEGAVASGVPHDVFGRIETSSIWSLTLDRRVVWSHGYMMPSS